MEELELDDVGKTFDRGDGAGVSTRLGCLQPPVGSCTSQPCISDQSPSEPWLCHRVQVPRFTWQSLPRQNIWTVLPEWEATHKQFQQMRLGRAKPLLESEMPAGIRSRVFAHDLLSIARVTFATRVMQTMEMMPGRGMVMAFVMTMMQMMLRR